MPHNVMDVSDVCSSNVYQANALGHRCNRMRVQCIPAVPKPRKRREGEFIAAHSFGSLPDYSTESTPVKQSAALPMTLKPAQEIVSGPKAAILSRSDLHYQDSKSFTAILSQGLGLEHSQTVSQRLQTSAPWANTCHSLRSFFEGLTPMSSSMLALSFDSTRPISHSRAFQCASMELAWLPEDP